MSKLQKLIERLCPEGVPFKSLEELGTFYGGLSGKSKDDFKDGNAKFVTYMNIYSNPALNLDIQDLVKVDNSEKQNRVRRGDILFTGSSETPNECGFTSVVTQNVNEPIYLNSFCFGLRLHNPEVFNLDFLKHLLRSDELRTKISKTASGVTRFNVSKARLAKITLPVPPLDVQNELAKILDRFADYAAELQAELQARKEQYEYYRNLLLTFSPSAYGSGTDDEQKTNSVTTWGGHSYEIAWKTMGEIMQISRGASPRPIQSFLTEDEIGIPWIKIGDISPDSKYVTKTAQKITSDGALKSRYLKRGDFILSNSMSFGRPYILEIDGCIHDGWVSLQNYKDFYLPDFLYHLLKSESVQKFWSQNAGQGGAVSNLNADIIRKTPVPIPPIELQEKIVAVLDRFETLVNDLAAGLPAEIAAVKEQYEYYRNKLLTFKQIA